MRLLLEGSAIEPLLERVRVEHGPTARIVHAERVRRGGVGGFFTREHFEVTVEVPGPDETATAAAGIPDADGPVRDDVPPPVVSRPDWAGSLGANAPASAVATGEPGLHALVAAAEAAERTREDLVMSTRGTAPATARRLDPAPPVSTESPAFAAVLAALHAGSESGPATSTVIAPRPDRPAPEPYRWPSAADVAVDVDAGVRAGRPSVTACHDSAPAIDAGLVDEVVSMVQIAPTVESEPMVRAEATDAEPGAGTEPVETAPVVEVVPVVRRSRRARAAAGDVAAVLDVVRSLPPVPTVPHRAGVVTLVVGEAAEADAAGARVAEQLRLLPQDVVVVGRQRAGRRCGSGPALTSAEQVAAARRRLRSGDVPAVVVLEVGTSAAEQVWAADVVDSLGADHVVAVVDAGRKAADLLGWLARLEEAGCWVDALSVHGAARTSDPESVLDLGLPVAELDGLPAAPGVWAALLLDRVAATPPATPSSTGAVPPAPGTRAARRRTDRRVRQEDQL